MVFVTKGVFFYVKKGGPSDDFASPGAGSHIFDEKGTVEIKSLQTLARVYLDDVLEPVARCVVEHKLFHTPENFR